MAYDIQLTLTGELEAWALSQADPRAAILDVLEAHVTKSATPFERAADILKEKVKALPDGLEFNIQQVIGFETWQALDRETRLGLGRFVRANQDAFGVEFLRKNSSNHAVYQRAVKL
ncbi:DUF1413 domain-containing protein [Pseudomonas japonica]|nr:DUF1413 domain-containing protein [Pseudomonas japonica]MBA1245835.1 DUF1413 domain-containing protein [Pseudomonas japonica]MBA1245927.1 DUF1413 domain-containing protein [Pseudomonas japonica]